VGENSIASSEGKEGDGRHHAKSQNQEETRKGLKIDKGVEWEEVCNTEKPLAVGGWGCDDSGDEG